ncbi:efflux RND transporter periplasmic adaptor subunit [Chloroflexota bacterium]
MNNKNTRNLLITVIVLTASLLAGCGSFGNSPTEAPEVVYQTSINEIETVSASGEVIPKKWVSLGFPSGGQNLNIFVDPGNIVSSKRLLAAVDHVAANTALENAKAQLANAKANLERLEDIDAPEIDIEAAEAAVKAAEANVLQASMALDNTYIYAPFNGTIVQVSGRVGENVQPGQQVILLADLSTLQVQTTDLSEVDVVHVKVGDPAEVSFDAFPDITVTGKVADISLGKSLGSGVYYQITVSLDEIPTKLRWGMSAFVVISVDAVASNSTYTVANTSTATNTTTPTNTPSMTPEPSIYSAEVLTVDGNGVNLRDAIEGDKLEVLLDGTELEVLSEEMAADGTTWLHVRTPDGIEGWIIKSATDKFTPEP